MEKLFLIQLITSFLAGGAAISLLTLIAEKAHSSRAGIILSLPTTMAIGLFFMGWTLSPDSVMIALPAIPMSLGASALFIATYVELAGLRLRKGASIAISLMGGLLLWFVVALPLATLKVDNLGFSLFGYALLSGLAHWMLNRKGPKVTEELKPLYYSHLQKVGRALFSGLMVSAIVFVSKTFGPFWGGVASVFPAANLSALLIYHVQRDVNVLRRVTKRMPIGFGILLIYAFTAAHTFPLYGIGWGTLISYSVTFTALAAFFGLRPTRA